MLSLVDRERPAESQLLTVPTHPHGNVKSAIFSTREANQYRQLVVWAFQVAGQPLPDGIGANSELSGPPARKVARRQPSHKGPRVASDASPDGPESKPASVRRPPSAAAGRPKGDDTAEAESADGVDLFDPAVFNERYHPADDPE